MSAPTSSSTATTKEEYLRLLNTPGISKNTIRRIKRKMREGEDRGETKEGINPAEESRGAVSASTDLNVNEGIDEVAATKNCSPIDQSIGAVAEKSTQGSVSTSIVSSDRVDGPMTVSPVPVPATPAKVSLPTGVAGGLLSMILGTSPVTSSANRLCSPRAMASGGFNHGAIGSEPRAPSAAAVSTQKKNAMQRSGALSGGDGVGSSYYKSKTGRAIRLD